MPPTETPPPDAADLTWDPLDRPCPGDRGVLQVGDQNFPGVIDAGGEFVLDDPTDARR